MFKNAKIRKKKTTNTGRKESFKLLLIYSKNFDTEANTNTNPLKESRFNKTKGTVYKIWFSDLIQLAVTKIRFFAWYVFCFFFSKPLFTQKEKLNLKTYNSTLLDIYRISVGEKLKNIKRKENIIILNIHINNTHVRFTLILKKKVIAGFPQIFENL